MTEKKFDFKLFLFLYIILFFPKIGIIDLKSIAMAIYLIVPYLYGNRPKLNRTMAVVTGCAFSLIMIFLINSMLNPDTYNILLFRYVRVILATICIYNYFQAKQYEAQTVINCFLTVMLIHACVILLEIVIPSIRPVVYLISGYSKKELPLRVSGLLSGYDFAGFYLNAAFVISIIYNVRYRNKGFSLRSIIYVAAIIFTSRLNIVVLLAQLVCVIFYLLRKRKAGSLLIVVVLIPIIFVGSVFAILTIDTFSDVKSRLMSRYQWVAVLDQTIDQTYSRSSLDSNIDIQYTIDQDVNKIIGNGIRGKTDPGYINTIYESGIIGLVIKLLCYFYIFAFCIMHRKSNIMYPLAAYVVILSLLFEIKLVFIFATGSYEMLITFLSAALSLEFESGEYSYDNLIPDKQE